MSYLIGINQENQQFNIIWQPCWFQFKNPTKSLVSSVIWIPNPKANFSTFSDFLVQCMGKIAQMVERATSNRKVLSSNTGLGGFFWPAFRWVRPRKLVEMHSRLVLNLDLDPLCSLHLKLSIPMLLFIHFIFHSFHLLLNFSFIFKSITVLWSCSFLSFFFKHLHYLLCTSLSLSPSP